MIYQVEVYNDDFIIKIILDNIRKTMIINSIFVAKLLKQMKERKLNEKENDN